MGKGGADYTSLMDDATMFKTAKWTTLAISFLTALAGAALIGVGCYGLLNPLGSAMVPMTLPIISVVTGGFVILLSLVGCFGSFGEHRNVLWTYFAIMMGLVFLQIVVGVAALNTRGQTITELADRRWTYLYEHQPRYIRDIEDQYECCGLKFVDDRAWPKPTRSRKACSKNRNFGYERPCIDLIKTEWEDRQRAFGVIVSTLAVLQLLGLVPAYYLASRLPTDEERRNTLLDEHRRLLTGRSCDGYGTHESPWDAEAPANVQHPVGGPAGAYPHFAAGSRPGSRVA
ncbi:Leukocyte surface antigen cd53 [Thoreauomyces humboldtii]|nr:Leukocyte surface antigen cd53 [Thoreauomyces humboldtii]